MEEIKVTKNAADRINSLRSNDNLLRMKNDICDCQAALEFATDCEFTKEDTNTCRNVLSNYTLLLNELALTED
jgi:hypothetical protein